LGCALVPAVKRRSATSGAPRADSGALPTRAGATGPLHVASIKLPAGFKIDLYAIVPDARHMAVGPNAGVVFVGTRKNNVYAVTDRDKDRVADEVKQFAPSVSFKIPNGVCFSRDGVLRSVEDSLDRLGLDRIDIAYLHDPDDHWQQASTTGIETLIELRDQGVLAAVGAGMNQSALLADLVRRTDVDVVMVAGRWTLLDQSAAEDLLPAASQRGVRVVAAGIYNSGLLSEPTVSDDARFDYREAPVQIVESARRIAAACARHGVTLPEAAVQFPFRHPAVASVVVGTRTAAHVSSLVTRSTAPVPDELWTDLVDDGLVPAAAIEQGT